MPIVGCIIEGCIATKHEGLGMCKRHYSASRPRAADKPRQATCSGCGIEVSRLSSKKYTKTYCSELCRHWIQWGAWSSPIPALHGVALRQRPTKAAPIKPVLAPTQCVSCGAMFAASRNNTTCSDACFAHRKREQKAMSRMRRRALQRAAFVAPVYRMDIYERDSYTCQLCASPLDMTATAPHPLSPTIDHVLALARGGTHEPSNVQSAHFLCNSRKGDRLAA